ncbi:tyrosine-type recombinase/integrase [Achromobacter xylosoxidans]
MIARRSTNLKLGLLPRMDARKRKGGGYTYRYLDYNRKYINLGHDRQEAIRQVLQFERRAPDTGTIGELVREFMASGQFANDLSERTQSDYLDASKHILKIFGTMQVSDVQPQHIARYLRIERSKAPVRANREIAFLGSAFQFGIECGLAASNPCRQVRRNKEKPRSRCPSWADIEGVYAVARAKGDSSHVLGLMAKFAALTGRRRAEFRQLRQDDLTPDGIRVGFAKAKKGEADRRGLIEWTPELRELFRVLATIERQPSMFVWTTRQGQPYTEKGFKAMWNRIMADWLKLPGTERFTFHDLRAYYVTVMVGRGENPETHANPATTRRVYDRRRIVKIKSA